MRIFYLTTFLTFCVIVAYSQTEKNNFLIGGNIEFRDSKSSMDGSPDVQYITINFNPQFAYFIIDNLALGIKLPMGFSKLEYNDRESKSSSFSIGPSLRYYILAAEKIAVFPELTYTLGMTTVEGQLFNPVTGMVEPNKVEGSTSQFKGGLGFTYFMNKSVGLEALFGYSVNFFEYDSQLRSDSTNSAIFLEIGFQIYL